MGSDESQRIEAEVIDDHQLAMSDEGGLRCDPQLGPSLDVAMFVVCRHARDLGDSVVRDPPATSSQR